MLYMNLWFSMMLSSWYNNYIALEKCIYILNIDYKNINKDGYIYIIYFKFIENNMSSLLHILYTCIYKCTIDYIIN